MLLEKVKTALRVSGTAFDLEVQDLIDAAKADLQGVGVEVIDTDPLHRQAVICFCKARYGYEDPNQADRYWASYEQHKIFLAVRAGVNGGGSSEPDAPKPTLTGIDLSKLDENEIMTMVYGDEAVQYGFKKTDTGYELVKPDDQGTVKITTNDEDDSPGGDSPHAT